MRAFLLTLAALPATAFGAANAAAPHFPIPLDHYSDAGMGLWDTLAERVATEPFNVVATTIFLLAILHTFLAPKFLHWSHEVEARHQRAKRSGVSFPGQVLHFFGEIEAVFGIWAVALALALAAAKGTDTAVDYLAHTVNYTEAMFVVVVMALASTRPVLRLAESLLGAVARVGGGGPASWWLSILIVAPVLGSFITEPAAMTIAALLLGKHLYALKPSPALKYATLGLLFVNISVGGTFTHFAAPPVLMVAGPWKWDTAYMASTFGWRALIGILISTTAYGIWFRKELAELGRKTKGAHETAKPVPHWVTAVHLGFLVFTVWSAHYPPLFIGGFLFFLGFHQATAQHQDPVKLRSPLLVGFFLAGLVVHGSLQGWWIEPVLKSLEELPLFSAALVLTAFNDNAAITFLATLVPSFSEGLKYAVVAGAVTGGGLTVIANAPNPAGQSLLQRYFDDGISAGGLLKAALLPTLIVALCFLL